MTEREVEIIIQRARRKERRSRKRKENLTRKGHGKILHMIGEIPPLAGQG